MTSAALEAEVLRDKIRKVEVELDQLRAQLNKVEQAEKKADVQPSEDDQTGERKRWPLSQEEYSRYGRQMIMPSIGLQGKYLLGFMLASPELTFHRSAAS